MVIRNIAKIMIFWLLCLQAGAVLSSQQFSFFTVETGNQLMDQEPCHDQQSSANASNVDHNHSIAESDVTPSETDCHEVDCQCCTNGCSSALAEQTSKIFSLVAADVGTLPSLFFPSTPVLSLFRPPITV